MVRAADWCWLVLPGKPKDMAKALKEFDDAYRKAREHHLKENDGTVHCDGLAQLDMKAITGINNRVAGAYTVPPAAAVTMLLLPYFSLSLCCWLSAVLAHCSIYSNTSTICSPYTLPCTLPYTLPCTLPCTLLCTLLCTLYSALCPVQPETALYQASCSWRSVSSETGVITKGRLLSGVTCSCGCGAPLASHSAPIPRHSNSHSRQIATCC